MHLVDMGQRTELIQTESYRTEFRKEWSRLFSLESITETSITRKSLRVPMGPLLGAPSAVLQRKKDNIR